MPTNGTRLDHRCRRLSDHARAFGPRIAVAASEPYRDRLPAGREVLDLRQLQAAVGERLEALRTTLVRREHRLAGELARGRALRRRRERLVAALRGTFRDLATTLTGVFGQQAVRRLFRHIRPLPSDPTALHLQAKRFFTTLVEPDSILPEAPGGVEVDLPAAARSFEQPIADLGAVLAALSEHEALVVHLRCDRDAVAEVLRQRTGPAERFFLALCELAGEDRLLERLRKSLRGS